jgi:hypothetical protein
VIPREHAIRSHDGPPGKEHLESWIVETSLDGDNWEEIDRRINTQDLNGLRAAQTFASAGRNACRYIRITNVG